MKNARPMREEMDGKVAYFPPESAFFNFDALLYKLLFPNCILTWRVNKHASDQEQVKIGEVKVQIQSFENLSRVLYF